VKIIVLSNLCGFFIPMNSKTGTCNIIYGIGDVMASILSSCAVDRGLKLRTVQTIKSYIWARIIKK